MSFTDETFAGGVLVQDAARSPNYVAGVSGWSINADGSAEFGAATVRGVLYVSNASGSYVKAYTVGTEAEIDLQPQNSPNAGVTFGSAVIAADSSAGIASGDQAFLNISSPYPIKGVAKRSAGLSLVSERTDINSPNEARIEAGILRVGWGETSASIRNEPTGLTYPAGQRGTVSTPVLAGATSIDSAVQTFPVAFTNTPIVIPVLSNTSAASASWFARAISISTTQFTVRHYGPAAPSGFTLGVVWIALDIL